MSGAHDGLGRVSPELTAVPPHHRAPVDGWQITPQAWRRGVVILTVCLAVALGMGSAGIWQEATRDAQPLSRVLTRALSAGSAEALSQLDQRQQQDRTTAAQRNQSVRTDLTTALAVARAVLDQSAGQVGDDQVRTTLGQALATADEALASSVPHDTAAIETQTALLEQATAQVFAAQAGVTAAQQQWQAQTAANSAAEAAVAEASGAADTTYNGQNGRLDPASLCPIPYDTKQLVRCDAEVAWMELDAAYKAVWGEDIPIDLSYRTYDEQVEMKAIYGSGAAAPGTSTHGWALAIDLPDWREGGLGLEWNYSTPKYEWMKANAPTYGWVNPAWAVEGGVGPAEPWHFEFVAYFRTTYGSKDQRHISPTHPLSHRA